MAYVMKLIQKSKSELVQFTLAFNSRYKTLMNALT